MVPENDVVPLWELCLFAIVMLAMIGTYLRSLVRDKGEDKHEQGV